MGVDFTENAQKLYRQHGVEMITLPAEELGRWKAALKPIVDKWADEWESKGQPARALLADVDRLAKKYDGMKADDLFKLVLENPAPGAIDF
jgi:hypothetical protein